MIEIVEIFLDSANLDEIRELVRTGIISGITTNQKIFLRERPCKVLERIQQILKIFDGQFFVELVSETEDQAITEAIEYVRIDPLKVAVKVPITADGRYLRTAKRLEAMGIRTNITLLMKMEQVLLALTARPSYVSIFYNRIKDCGEDPIKVIKESMEIIKVYNTRTRVIVGSIRDPQDVVRCALAGPHVITVPYSVLKNMLFHPKSEEILIEFKRAWNELMQRTDK